MLIKKKLTLGYCSGNGGDIAPFDAVFSNKKDIAREGMDDVDAVLFWGGTDINPELYGDERHPLTQRSDHARDEFEWKAMTYCKAKGIPLIGVCRGAQLTCAFAGGILIQDCGGHGRDHAVITSDGEILDVTSSHHQMMYPYGVDHKLLAWSHYNLSKHYHAGNMKEIVGMANHKEAEIVFFPQIRGLAIQGHPEWDLGSRFADLCNEYVRTYLL